MALDIRELATYMQRHEARPYVAPIRRGPGWYMGPTLQMHSPWGGDLSSNYPMAPYASTYNAMFWGAIGAWFWAFEEEDPATGGRLSSSTNTKIEVANLRVQIRRASTNAWSMVETVQRPHADEFWYSYSGSDAPGGNVARVTPTKRNEAIGVSYKITDSGRWTIHGYGTPTNLSNPADVVAVCVDMEHRLILDNPAGTDDRASARFVVGAAVDRYPQVGAAEPASRSWPAIVTGGMRRVTTSWQHCHATNYFTGARNEINNDVLASLNTLSLLQASMPIGYSDGGGTVPTPEPPPPTGTTTRVLFVGDDYIVGNDAVASSWRTVRGATILSLNAAGLNVDAIGRQRLTPVVGGDPDHEGYAGAYLSTTSDNIAARLDVIMQAAGAVPVVVLMVGLADYVNAPSGIADRFSALLTSVRTLQPSADIVVCTMPPRQGLSEAQTAAAFSGYAALNARIRFEAQSRYGVTLADTSLAALASADYFDAARLLQPGADKVGAVIATAVRAALGAPSAYVIPGRPRIGRVFPRYVTTRGVVAAAGFSPAAPQILTVTIPTPSVGVPYGQTIAVSGSPTPTLAVTAGALPSGLTLSGTTISGTPLLEQDYNFTITASAAGQPSASQQYTGRTTVPPVITTTTLPSVVSGSSFRLPISVTGTAPIVLSISDRGTLPAGIDISGIDLVGVAPAGSGTFTFVVQAAGAGAIDTQALSLTVGAASAPTVTTLTLPPAQIGQPYFVPLTATGTGPFTWSIAGDALWTGLALQGAAIVGVPGVQATGTRTYTLTATGPTGAAGSQSVTLTLAAVADAPVITTTTLATGTVGVTYSQAVVASGATPIEWEVVGSLPPGLTLTPGTGGLVAPPPIGLVMGGGAAPPIIGTPTMSGTYGFTLRARNAAGSIERSFVLQILATATAPVASPWGRFIRQ